MMLYMLKPNSERILRAIMRSSAANGHELSIPQIASEAHCSPKTVERHLQSLKVSGYIALDRPNRGTRYSIFIQPTALAELGVERVS